ncbi:MAG TPA: acyl-CoA dehydrogenase C-terminal domain-containing protein [Burkholderiales bacterium]|nr:acyl-CoA dehydrogenase C-terminal domain-containing protein [Burkholderiales bacterium]
MSTYAAPLQDMQFVIKELVGLADITAMPACAEVTGDVVDAVLGEAGKFAAAVLDPLNRSGDEQGARLIDGKVAPPQGFKEAYAQFIAAGWNGLSGATEFGGQGLPHVVAMPVQEMWNSANMAFCLCPMLTSGVLEALTLRGTPAQQKIYLPRLISGEWCGTMNLTEPQAGSDLSAVRTRAMPQGDHYLIHGTKIFITWGEHDMTQNIVHLVLARTPDAPEGVKGISLFIVPKFFVNPDGSLGERNDIKCVSIEHKLGIRASPTCVLAYGDRKGAVGYLVGQENRGLEYMFIMMNHERLGVGIEGVGLAERAYQHAREYAKTRVQGRAIGQKGGDRVTIIHHPDVKRMLLTMKSQVEAMRALAYTVSAALDKSRHHPDDKERRRNQALVDFLIPIVKGWCTEQGIEIASIGMQIHGGMGFVEETGAAQYLRDARITAIYEGTTGIQAADLVGRKVAFDKGTTAFAVIDEMRGLDGNLARSTNADVAAQRDNLKRAVDGVAAATQWVVDTFPNDPNAVAAVSVPFLKLWGTVVGGWLMARAASIADSRLGAGGDPDFYRAKIATARFYAEHILPQAAAISSEVVNGASSVLALTEEQF